MRAGWNLSAGDIIYQERTLSFIGSRRSIKEPSVAVMDGGEASIRKLGFESKERSSGVAQFVFIYCDVYWRLRLCCKTHWLLNQQLSRWIWICGNSFHPEGKRSIGAQIPANSPVRRCGRKSQRGAGSAWTCSRISDSAHWIPRAPRLMCGHEVSAPTGD